MGIAHQPHDFRIARSGRLGLAEQAHRGVGLIGVDQPPCLELARLHMAGILGQHGLDLGHRVAFAAGGREHPGICHAQVVRLGAVRGGGEHLLEFQDRRLGVALIEPQGRAQAAQNRGVALGIGGQGGDLPVDLGQSWRYAADLAQKIDEGQAVGDLRRLIRRPRAQKPLHRVLIALAQVPVDEQLLRFEAVGKLLRHHFQRVSHSVVATKISQGLHIQLMQGVVVRQNGERRVNLGQRVFGAAKSAGIRDQDLSCDQVVRFPFDVTAGDGGGGGGRNGILRPDRRPEVQGGAYQGRAVTVRRQRLGLFGETNGFVPAVPADRDLGQREPRLGRVGVVVDQPLIGAERGVLGAAGHLDGGKLRQRLAVGRLVFEDVAELQHRRSRIAPGDERLGVLQMPGGPVLGVLAGDEREEENRQAKSADRPEVSDHVEFFHGSNHRLSEKRYQIHTPATFVDMAPICPCRFMAKVKRSRLRGQLGYASSGMAARRREPR